MPRGGGHVYHSIFPGIKHPFVLRNKILNINTAGQEEIYTIAALNNKDVQLKARGVYS